MENDLKRKSNSLPLKDCYTIMLTSFMVFFYFTSAWFNGDDFLHLYRLSGELGNPYIKALSGNIYGSGQDIHYRPISNVAFALLTEQGSSFIFRLFTLILHISSGGILWLVLRKLIFNRFAVFMATLLVVLTEGLNKKRREAATPSRKNI